MSDGAEYTDENLGVGGSNPSHRTNSFPATETPILMASHMAKIAKIQIDDRMLEPSAGFGPIAFAARSMGAKVTCIELNEACCEHLTKSGWYDHVIRADFLKWEGAGFPLFDAVLMCPPKNAIPHVEHALTFLKPNGRLVALIRRDSVNLEKYIDNYKPLPYMFHMNGKDVEAGLLII